MILYGHLAEEATFTNDNETVQVPAGALIEVNGEDLADCGESWAYVREGEHFGAAAIISIHQINPA
ncbi:hypothetical protein [Corynebacterium minutissimum]|uniref:Uncharacterized protein n=1 Tax=Corynebacterium minutissimum TaxID=38301 RepID=A0A376CY35_9CORY|nr:hypothetical protein [Corynebacterium minutissimum]QRP60894.1 hypothetical protein I6J26_12230 [Corynebacterium minutissimum]STC77600.1 Uncharacterised protein [Corynebacterium minutissimum]STD79112.1 Uncharacterised protein [Corynebacterium minutissimum]